jgi:hypothetical protein
MILQNLIRSFSYYKQKGKVVLLHSMKTHRRRRGTAPLNLNLGAIWRRVVNFTSWPIYAWEIIPVPTEQEAVWVPYPVWTFFGNRKCLEPSEIRIPYCPASS